MIISKKPDKPIKILITNSHADNRGDEAAQRSLINTISSLLPNVEFTVLTTSPQGLDLPSQVQVIETFTATNKNFFLLSLWTIFRSWGLKLPTFGKGQNIFTALEKIATADIIISAPGGPYFGELYPSHEIGEHLFHLYLSKILKKPLMIYGPSMGPFKSLYRNRLRKYLLNKADIISLRDHISQKYLSELKLKHPLIYLSADSAFQDKIKFNEEKIKEIMKSEKIIASPDTVHGPLIGITPTGERWNFPQAKDPKKEQQTYNQTMAKTIDYLINKFKATIVFFPQLYGNSSDIPLIKDIIKLVDNPLAVKILSPQWDSETQQAIIAHLDLFIGNRYHSIIFSLNQNIPVVGLAYEHKSTGVMQAAKLDDFVIQINDLTYDTLIEKINLALTKKNEIKEQLIIQVETIRKKALVNSILALALIKYSVQNSFKKENLKTTIDKLMQEFQEGKLPLYEKNKG